MVGRLLTLASWSEETQQESHTIYPNAPFQSA